MRSTKRPYRLLFGLLVAWWSTAAPLKGGACTLKYVESSQLDKVFPYYPRMTDAERRVVDLLFEPLARETLSGRTQSWILNLDGATSHSQGAVWAFPLKNTKWHSGKRLSGDQINQTFAQLLRLDQDGWTDWVQELPYFHNIKSMNATNDTLFVRYDRPFNQTDAESSLRNFYVIPWDDLPGIDQYNGRLEDYVPNSPDIKSRLVGNGRWQAGSEADMISPHGTLTLTRDNDFPATPATQIEGVSGTGQPVGGERVNCFTTGQCNLVLEVPEKLRSTARIPGSEEINHPQNSFTSIQIGTRNPALADKKVREALIYAIDRNTILSTQYNGEGEVLDAPFPRGTLPYNKTVIPRGYDPAKAVALLQQAGFTGNAATGWRKDRLSLNGLYLLVERTMQSGDDEDVLRSILDNWHDIGVNVEQDVVEPGEAYPRLREGRYDFYVETYISGNAWDLMAVLSDSAKGHEENSKAYCSPDVRRLLNEYDAVCTGDRARAEEVGQRLHAAIAASADRIYLWSLKRHGVFNGDQIVFKQLGTTLFMAPQVWTCPIH